MVFIREQYPGLISEGKIYAFGFNIYLTRNLRYRRQLPEKDKLVITRQFLFNVVK